MHNKCLDDHWIASISGVSKEAMLSTSNGLKSVSTELRNLVLIYQKAITNIFRTTKTVSDGNWNVEVHCDLFQITINHLREHLLALCTTHSKYKKKSVR